MKKLIFICLIISSFPIANYSQGNDTVGQKLKLSHAYLNFGGGVVSKGFIGEIGGNFIFSNNWGGSLIYDRVERQAKELPNNYQTGLCVYGNCIPMDELTSISINIVKELPTSTKKVRFGIEGGVSLVQYQSLHFTYNNNSGLFGSNYIVTYADKKNAVGLSLRAKAEFPLTRFFGLELATVSNINKYQSYLGIGFYITLGLVRDRLFPKNNILN